MIDVSLDMLLDSPTAIAIIPPALVGLAALRRTILSKSSNIYSYIGVTGLAGAVCQANILFLAEVPPAVVVISGAAVVALWLEVRLRADARRKVKTSRQGARTRTNY